MGLLLAAGCGDDGDDPEAAPATGGTTNAAEVLGPSDPASGEPVRIGLISDDKGPVSDLAIEGQVAEATVAYLNEHRSGIAGRPIKLVRCESYADPAVGTDCANRMVEENVAAVIVGSSAVVESIWEPLRQARMPVLLTYAAGAPLRDSETTFALADSFYPINAVLQQAKEQSAKKVSIVAIDVPSTMIVMQTLPPIFQQAGHELEVVPVPPGTADMTPQMQNLVAGDPDVVHVIGNDAFCISAFNGLRTAGYDGSVVAHPNCISDKTREAVPGDFLEGMIVPAMAPNGSDNPSTRLYHAVATTYGKDIDINRIAGLNMFVTVAAFEAAADGVTGEITPESIVAAFRSMPEKELPGAGGLRFRCNGKADPDQPAVCVSGWLVTTLDGAGRPTEYKVAGAAPIEG